MDEEKIIQHMMQIGINKYESKAYIALIKRPGITAYELSKLSGVPQAKIYETMNKLLEKKLVNIIGDNPTKYIAVDFEDYLDNYKKSVSKTVKFLKENVKEVNSNKKVSYMWHLQGKENIISKIKKVLSGSKKFIYLECWKDEYEFFKKELKELEKKGIEIVTVLYGESDEKIGEVYLHEMKDMDKDAREFGRWFTLVSDGNEALFSVFKGSRSQGIWTENEAFMLMAECFIVHDIFLAEIYKKYRKELDKEFGPNLKKIREKVHIG
ncbi:TrmB family transcriptional regulator [Tepidibacter formicigenes]|jgi:sugar-specific transcriptional regulator TrmB|uniref:Sugar-specific transcriptional regulator TrmB n=1 Tax=Tepidibacter formicigenes DSM 15518 TaxID=1123349 RepID=A0A1M6QXX9_9FIRM|nr:helix-turn-helix domain-containing protein [Tepidibacter formicigenes]SHK25055.1 Sugar-specific transcriptional regulator TrmB [Tepidibacter formicigenes DSM 15518]